MSENRLYGDHGIEKKEPAGEDGLDSRANPGEGWPFRIRVRFGYYRCATIRAKRHQVVFLS